MIRRPRCLMCASASTLESLRNSLAFPAPLGSSGSIGRRPDLPMVLDALSTSWRDAEVSRRSMRWITELDVDDESSRCIAQSSGLNAMIEAMKAHTTETDIRERCCRVICNVCMLGLDSAVASLSMGRSSSSNNTTDSMAAADRQFSVVLVDMQCVELVLGVMSEAKKLSLAGRHWAALALQNLLVLSTNASASVQQRCIDHDGIDTVSSFLLDVVSEHRAAVTSLSNQNAVDREELRRRSLGAADASLTVLFLLLNAEVPDNAGAVKHYFQRLTGTTMEACVSVLASLVLCCTQLELQQQQALRSSSTPATLGNVANSEAGALVPSYELLPIVHKAWDILRLTASHKPNHGLLFDVWADWGNDFLSVLRISTSWCTPDVVFLSTGADGVAVDSSVAGHDAEMRRLINLLHDAVVRCLTDLASVRGDLKAGALTAAEGAAGGETEVVSATLPTASAHQFLDIVSAGVVSSWSNAVIAHGVVLVETALAAKGTVKTTDSGRICEVLAAHVALVSNLAETDPHLSSPTMVTLLARILSAMVRLVDHRTTSELPATSNDLGGDALLLQFVPLAGHSLTYFWNVLNTDSGRNSVRDTGSSSIVRQLTTSVESCVTRKRTSGGATAGTAAADVPSSGTQEETTQALGRLLSMAMKVVEKLDATVDSPQFVE